MYKNFVTSDLFLGMSSQIAVPVYFELKRSYDSGDLFIVSSAQVSNKVEY